MPAITKNVVNVDNNGELLSYIINQTPELKEEIDLPRQGESIQPIGRIIMNNVRYKNAFLNTINLIGLTVIKRNSWENPWNSFTEKGSINVGQQIREMIVDLADIYDYNKTANNPTNFLKTVVPNIYNYIHELNYQKYYKVTISDEQIAMAFSNVDGLFDLIDVVITGLYETYEYDKYIVNKYMLCRRILDGTIPAVHIDGYDQMDKRDRVAFVKDISNLMTFKKPNFNPAGIRKATPFDKQYLILNTTFQSDMTTNVLATSYFIEEAKLKTNMALIDTFNDHDFERLKKVLEDAYIPFTEEEIKSLESIPAMIIAEDFFMNYNYSLDNQAEPSNADGTRRTDFVNPETLKHTQWLHTWKVLSTSPFANCVLFTTEEISVESVAISPATATISKGQELKLQADVSVNGFANKAVIWSIQDDKATIDQNGVLKIASDHESGDITVTATSVYDSSKKNTAVITVA